MIRAQMSSNLVACTSATSSYASKLRSADDVSCLTKNNEDNDADNHNTPGLLKNINNKKRRLKNFFRTSTSQSSSSDQSVVSAGTAKTETEKCLAFASEDTIHDTISRKDLSKEEIEAAWFTEEETREITRQCCKQISKMNMGEALRDRKYCSRGLEGHTRLRSIAKAQNRGLSIRAVLLVQDSQVKEGIVDERAISQAYINVSSSCQMSAHIVGLHDERQALEAYQDDDDEEEDNNGSSHREGIRKQQSKRPLLDSKSQHSCRSLSSQRSSKSLDSKSEHSCRSLPSQRSSRSLTKSQAKKKKRMVSAKTD